METKTMPREIAQQVISLVKSKKLVSDILEEAGYEENLAVLAIRRPDLCREEVVTIMTKAGFTESVCIAGSEKIFEDANVTIWEVMHSVDFSKICVMKGIPLMCDEDDLVRIMKVLNYDPEVCEAAKVRLQEMAK